MVLHVRPSVCPSVYLSSFLFPEHITETHAVISLILHSHVDVTFEVMTFDLFFFLPTCLGQ